MSRYAVNSLPYRPKKEPGFPAPLPADAAAPPDRPRPARGLGARPAVPDELHGEVP